MGQPFLSTGKDNLKHFEGPRRFPPTEQHNRLLRAGTRSSSGQCFGGHCTTPRCTVSSKEKASQNSSLENTIYCEILSPRSAGPAAPHTQVGYDDDRDEAEQTGTNVKLILCRHLV